MPRVTVALVGAALMVVIGATDDHGVFFSEDSGIDWNVIFLLLGMMIIVGILQQSGVFEFLAIWAAKRAKGRPFVIMVMLVVITAVLSAFLDNVTTVLLIAPVTLLICDRLGTPPDPVPHRRGDGEQHRRHRDPDRRPAEHHHRQPQRTHLQRLHRQPRADRRDPARRVHRLVLADVPQAAALRRRRGSRAIMALNEREAIRDVPLLIKSLVVLALVLAGFVLHSVIHLEPAIVALLGAGLLILLTRLENRKIFADVEWETLVFFAGLFIMVGSLVNLGVIEMVGKAAIEAVGDNYFGAATGLLVGSAVFSGIVDNIPYVATLAPLTNDLVQAGGAPAKPLWWALALGRGPRRQRDGDRRQRERGRARHRQAQRAPDLVLAVHQVRADRHRRDRRAVRALPVAALLRGMRSAIFRVGVVSPALAVVPRRPLIAERGDAAGVLQHPGHMHQVPGHEGGVAIGEIVLGPA